jgi:hypothetical protein
VLFAANDRPRDELGMGVRGARAQCYRETSRQLPLSVRSWRATHMAWATGWGHGFAGLCYCSRVAPSRIATRTVVRRSTRQTSATRGVSAALTRLTFKAVTPRHAAPRGPRRKNATQRSRFAYESKPILRIRMPQSALRRRAARPRARARTTAFALTPRMVPARRPPPVAKQVAGTPARAASTARRASTSQTRAPRVLRARPAEIAIDCANVVPGDRRSAR